MTQTNAAKLREAAQLVREVHEDPSEELVIAGSLRDHEADLKAYAAFMEGDR